DAGLGQRGVDDAVVAEVLLQAVGDAEDATEPADVRAHEHDLGVVFHRAAQPEVECLHEGQRLDAHRSAPSKLAWYSTNSARCSCSSGVRSAYTVSKIAVPGGSGISTVPVRIRAASWSASASTASKKSWSATPERAR